MDRKKELIIIGVAMLLVLAVGITMAFFSQNVDVKGEANQSVDVQTITIEDTTLKVEGKLQFNDLDIYPGHKNISSIKVTATGDKELLYNLTWTGINTLNTPLKYTVYKTLSEVSPSITCSKKSLQLHYFETCEETNFDKLGTPIATGNIPTATTETKFKLAYNESVQATSDGVVYYYYVVLEFPNLDTDQNLDMGGEFDGISSAEVLDERDNTAPIKMDDIINNSNAKTETPDFSVTATTDEGVYAVSDGMYGGTSYYWRGATTTNYVKFAGKCWRIVRINGDKTMRLIYDGATCHANGEVTTDSIAIQNAVYNSNYNKSEYVGWTYAEGLQRPANNNEGIQSNVKSKLEEWYNTNLKSYESKIAEGKYCNDRNVASGSTWSSAPSSNFNYAGYKRLYTDYAPTLSCTALDTYILKVGLIAADEVEFAGSKNVENKQFYLYNGQTYWTMTPGYWSADYNYAGVFAVYSDGNLTDWFVDDLYNLRPVINLKAETFFVSGGTGTQSNPYVVL
ncbi:MAG: hypothetical protein HFI36_06910 [Bacilli bacterium]|jgi:hypothetical protein|nr:hypothetical protein [Bacilli bacterium]